MNVTKSNLSVEAERLRSTSVACAMTSWLKLAESNTSRVCQRQATGLYQAPPSAISPYPAFSSSSSLDPEPVLVGRSSSGTILELLLLPSIVVSANLFVCAIFSIILPPAVRSDILCFLAARCFFALVRRAYGRVRGGKKSFSLLKINH
jgi:hypothetical protein